MKRIISPEIINKAKKKDKASKEVQIPLHFPERSDQPEESKKKEKSKIIVIELA